MQSSRARWKKPCLLVGTAPGAQVCQRWLEMFGHVLLPSAVGFARLIFCEKTVSSIADRSISSDRAKGLASILTIGLSLSENLQSRAASVS